MRQFEVTVDLSDIYPRIKNYNLREYGKTYPRIKLTAASPDHACHLITKNLLDLLNGQFSVNDQLLSEVRRKMRIKRLVIQEND